MTFKSIQKIWKDSCGARWCLKYYIFYHFAFLLQGDVHMILAVLKAEPKSFIT